MKKIGINGLGRIGRLVLKHYIENPSEDVKIVAANDLTSIEDLIYLLKYDSVYGISPYIIENEQDKIRIQPIKEKGSTVELEDVNIKFFQEKKPENIPWENLDVDIVLECTGLFRRREDAAKHLDAGASKVIISAPSKSADITIVQGVNHEKYEKQTHHIISNASCTTNSLAPAVKVLNDVFKVKHLLVTTIHAYTASQNLVDGDSRKRRRGRAAAINLVPTSSGAAKATELVLPELKGKMDAMAVRVPVIDGAITDIVAELEKDVTVDTINEAFKEASDTNLKGILKYSEEDLVSSDIIGDGHSGIVDAKSTRVIDDNMVKILVWYDNEAGYAKKILELAEYISTK
ncbi:MAG: type I glyceraldehyde-3-phosphate dehydrogenase [Candidatus Thermoplasmatota archaeon]|nr:type I glyceraldehyde-3-phosphate dehydrogenase [Candidatus Thermoplasmatota archaeon]